MKLLEVENLTVQYPGSANPACKVSFQVESGELLGIAGASGAGKSTAMLALMGILPEQVQITSEKIEAARDKSNDLSGCFGIFKSAGPCGKAAHRDHFGTSEVYRKRSQRAGGNTSG